MKASMACWHWERNLFLFLNPTCVAGATAFVSAPLYVCLFALFPSFPPFSLSTSLPLHLQFQPFVQLVGRRSQEASSGGPSKRQVQRTHLSDSAVRQEEEQHPAAAAQWQEQSLWLPQWGVSQKTHTLLVVFPEITFGALTKDHKHPTHIHC